MNRENMMKWIDALRSGKYKQSKGNLCRIIDVKNDEYLYCCLGVLCETAIDCGVNVGKNKMLCARLVEYDGEPFTPPIKNIGLVGYYQME